MHITHQHLWKHLLPLGILSILFSCHSLESPEVSDVYEKYKFDITVIQKLPVYDSLASAILEKYTFFRQNIKDDDAYKSYKYMPGSDASDVHKQLPADIAPAIDRWFATLGNDFVAGFTVYTDSSIKISIRNRLSKTALVDVEENLSYYPKTGSFQHREYPVKDTILNEHWQYWARFNKRGLF